MAKKESPKKPQHPVFFYASMLLIGLALVFLLVPKNKIVEVGEGERRIVADVFGEQTAEHIKGVADFWYTKAFIDTDFLYATYDFMIAQWDGDERDIPLDDRGLGRWSEQRLDTLWLVLYQVFYRMAILMVWLPYVFPFMMAVTADAYLQREVGKWRFSFSSPLAHKGGIQMVSVIVFGFFAMPFLPIPIHPMTTPVLVFALSFATWVSIVNIHKRV